MGFWQRWAKCALECAFGRLAAERKNLLADIRDGRDLRPMPASTTSRKPAPKKPKKKPPHRLAPSVPRTADGKFVKGFSGHPSGVRAIPPEIRELAREHGPAALLRLVALTQSADESICVAACREILNRAYGRPESTVNLPNGGALVNFNMFAGSGQIKVTTAEEAEAAYRAIAGDPKFDFSRIEYVAAPAQPYIAGDPTSNVTSIDAAKAARDALWIKLGQ
jgi:hypothetical protein